MTNTKDTKKSTSVRLPQSLYEQLKKRAADSDLSMAQAIRRAIALWLKKTER